jgi:hypothetical protein
MANLERYRSVIKSILNEYAMLPISYAEAEDHAIFDDDFNRYILVTVGWYNGKRLYRVVMHLELRDGKVWIECNNTDQDIAQELVDGGIPATDIVIAFHRPELRVHSGYAVE